MMGRPFPGFVYGPAGESLACWYKGLTQAELDTARVRSTISRGEYERDSEGFADGLGRIWRLNANTKFTDIPARERYAARAVMRCGMAVLLLAPDADTEASVRAGLLGLIDADDTPLGRFGHA